MFECLLATFAGYGALQSTPTVINLGMRFGWVDQPGVRKQHHTPTVRVGGIGICLGLMISFLGLFLTGGTQLSEPSAILWALMIGSLLSFAIGITDDIRGLSPLVRLVLQAGVTCLVWTLGIRIESLPIPGFDPLSLGWLSLPVTFLWLAGVSNAVNWLDGLDGLAAGTGAIASAILSIVCAQLGCPVEAVLALSLSTSLLGFLYYNSRPAQLFMGDGGAYLIGFLLSSLAITGPMAHAASASTLWISYLILSVPILDMLYVIVSRVKEGKSPFYPDRRHLHHRLLDHGYSYDATVNHVYALTAISGGLAVSTAGAEWFAIASISLALALLIWNLVCFYQIFSMAQRS